MRQFGISMQMGDQTVEVSQNNGKIETRPLYFDNQSTTTVDPR